MFHTCPICGEAYSTDLKTCERCFEWNQQINPYEEGTMTRMAQEKATNASLAGANLKVDQDDYMTQWRLEGMHDKARKEYWASPHREPLSRTNYDQIVVDGEAYRVKDETLMTGLGGRKIIIKFKDGRTIFTDNLERLGRVAVETPNNAVFLQSVEQDLYRYDIGNLSSLNRKPF